MKKSKKQPTYYVVIDDKNGVSVRKFLSKVQSITEINSNTLSKHFSMYKSPYSNGEYTVYKCYDLDLKSNNRGNLDNFHHLA